MPERYQVQITVSALGARLPLRTKWRRFFLRLFWETICHNLQREKKAVNTVERIGGWRLTHCCQ